MDPVIESPNPMPKSELSMRLLLPLSIAFVALSLNLHAHQGHECDLNFKAKSIDGETVDLEDYEGNVVVVVNVASQCGLTGQYSGLQDLYAKYKDKGLVVLGFPCNQFGSQEPGTEAEIKQFCSTKFNVSFPMFGKVDVKGENAAPFFKNLSEKDAKPKGKGEVSWNFEKFLIDREGKLAHRFAPNTEPSDPEFLKAIESALAKK
jgi:glutathione peroxidase